MAAIRPVVSELSSGCDRTTPGAGWLHSLLTTDWSWSGRPGGIYQLFQEMEDKDAHLFATLQTRKNALLACPWKVVAADDSAVARKAADIARENLAALPNFNTALYQIMDAVAKGFSVAEVIWKVEGSRVRVADIRARSQAEFAFDLEGRLYLLNNAAASTSPPTSTSPLLKGESGPKRHLMPRPGESWLDVRRAQLMPERKFIHFAFQGNACTPYGSPLCVKAYWYYWLKKNTLQHWALFNEKFGSPTAVARYSATLAEEDIRQLEETLASLPRDSGVLLPEGVGLEFLEARRSSGANTYRELADWCNDELSKIVLGQTLTTGEGRRSGSLALGQVHEAVRRDYLAGDASIIGQMLSSQLLRWLTDFNVGLDAPTPRLVFDVDPPEHFESELRVDRELVKMGVPIAAGYFYERYRRPVPAEGERTLRFDDANLYQYHLLHGVLTINEVRASLGLEPVPWGDRPTGQGSHDRNRPGEMPPGFRSPAGDQDLEDADEAEGNEERADRRR